MIGRAWILAAMILVPAVALAQVTAPTRPEIVNCLSLMEQASTKRMFESVGAMQPGTSAAMVGATQCTTDMLQRMASDPERENAFLQVVDMYRVSVHRPSVTAHSEYLSASGRFLRDLD